MIHRVMDAIDDKKALLAHEQLAIRFMAEHPDEFEEYHGDVSGGMKVVTRLLKRTIREGQATGEIRSDIDARVITGTIGAVLRGSAMMKTVRHLNLLPVGASEDVVDLLMGGLEPR
jgi:hypothetical protein